MFRIRIRCVQGRRVTYTNLDVIKDAALAMLESAGCPGKMLSGPEARHWGAGPVTPIRISPLVRRTREIVVSTPDPDIAHHLLKADPAAMRKDQPATGERIDMSGARIVPDPDPIVPGSTFIDAFMLTPIAISRRGDRTGGRWHADPDEVELSAAVNRRLSRIAGRSVRLTVAPDDMYVATRRQSCATRVDVKRTGSQSAVVIGMTFPFVLCGCPADLRLAWYAGIGEKNRLGFGFFGLAA
jgi:CRISPR-associated endoribonuclease Cas6